MTGFFQACVIGGVGGCADVASIFMPSPSFVCGGRSRDFERGHWVIDGEDGRPVHVEGNHPSAAGLSICDRVEVEPQSPSSIANPMATKYWTIVRKLNGGDA
jgi:hypothetical protein